MSGGPTWRTKLLDAALVPFVVPAAKLLGYVRQKGLRRLPRCRRALFALGLLPVRAAYDEPFVGEALARPARPRRLPGLDWNVEEQLRTLEDLRPFAGELHDLGSTPGPVQTFHFGNAAFEAGDAECWYAMVRARKPRLLIEVGSGHSTKLAARALRLNAAEGRPCEHVCIEPYEAPWLSQLDVKVLRRPVEDVGPELFERLQRDDILFIDSSHVIRPGGDVLFEYLEVLPTLRPGVVVHVHDVFSPRDYPDAWLREDVKLWNEQYLVEALLSGNRDWKMIGALNYLHHEHAAALRACCPHLTPGHVPGSLYLQKVR